MSILQELIEAEAAIPAFVERRWSRRTDDQVVLVFPASGASGYDVEVYASEESITVYADVAHLAIDDPSDARGRVQEALALVQDLRSPRTRLRIHFAGGQPYRWTVEEFEDGEWKGSFLTGLLFWNYFGRRSQVIRQNALTPEGSSHSTAEPLPR